MSFETTEQAVSRIIAPFNNLRLKVDVRLADRRHVNALRRRGRELANSPAAAEDDRLLPLLTALSRHQGRLDGLTLAMAKSRDDGRTECAVAPPWLHPLVLLRGFCERALLNVQVRSCRRDMGTCHEALGRAERGDIREGTTMRDLPAEGGELTPNWTGVLAREGRELAAEVGRQLHGKLVPKASALAGLAAGWWVASTYTDSHLKSIMSSIGIGKGGTHLVSGTTYKAMSFWLPILAAALCAYLGNRIARAVHRGD